VEVGGLANPVLDADFPDPGLLKVGARYYAYSTNAGGMHVPVARSKDLLHWKVLRDALPVLPAWAQNKLGDTWAPAVTLTPEGYVMYFATRCSRVRKGIRAIGAAMSQSPEGPFEPIGNGPLICQGEEGGSIDPSVFVDDDGSRYLLWKNDGNPIGRQTWIYIQKVSVDGLTLRSEAVPLIANDQPWEGHLIEGPTLHKRDGFYYLFHSANSCTNARYAIGYAVADCIWGPYVKSPLPFFTTDKERGIVGPGGQDIVAGPDNSTLFFYHAWSPKGHRALHVSRLTWHE
jgi:arabinan endo-1,5-alpha-L-arabinosidase